MSALGVLGVAAVVGVLGVGAPVDEPGDDPRLGPPLVVQAIDPDGFAPVAVVGDLRDGTVSRLAASGFAPDSDGSARQCRGTAPEPRRCTAAVPLRFDDEGVARGLFLLTDEIPGGGACTATGALCELEVRGEDGRRAVLRTVFGAPTPPLPRVGIAGAATADPDAVALLVAGLRPGERAVVALCAPPALDATTCGAPGPVVAVVGDAEGRARAELVVAAGPVGTGERPCGRRDPCRIAVLLDGQVRGRGRGRVAFPGGPTATYDDGRLVAGLLVAAALALLAVHIGRTTDWSRPDEPQEATTEP